MGWSSAVTINQRNAATAPKPDAPYASRRQSISGISHDAFSARVDVELGIDRDELTNPWHAAISSAISFTLGAMLPMLAILLLPPAPRIPVTFVAVLIALGITGWISARLGGADPARATKRVLIGGALAMAITYGIGLAMGGVIPG